MPVIIKRRLPPAIPVTPQAPAPQKKIIFNSPARSDTPIKTPLMTLKEAALVLKVSVKTVRRLIKSLEIPVLLVGSQVRIHSGHIVLFTGKRW